MSVSSHASQTQGKPRWVVLLWCIMLCWSSYVLWRAHGELNDQSTVAGLFRNYAPPYIEDGAWVVDPKTTSVFHELKARYGISSLGRDALTWTPHMWCQALNAKGRRCILSSDKEKISSVHLRFETSKQRPKIWLGRLGLRHVLFEEGIGVVVRDAVPPAEAILSLPDAQEKPW